MNAIALKHEACYNITTLWARRLVIDIVMEVSDV